MLKLSKYLLGFGFLIVILTGYSVFDNDDVSSQSAQSIFGRNIYEQENDLGARASPEYRITFPLDHRSHDQFDIEWWYLTANLKDESGRPFGLQWTLFRFRNPSLKGEENSIWNNEQVFMAHSSIHSLEEHWFTEKFARGGVGNAGLVNEPFSLYIDDWEWSNTNKDKGLLPARLSFTAKEVKAPFGNIKADFTLTQTGPYIFHGDNGYSVKSNNMHASHYYSAPFISIKGELTSIENENPALKLSGKAWFDHEWTSQLLDDTTLGWDWLSLHLENGSKIMAFRMRISDQKDFITASYISGTGQIQTLQGDQITLTPSAFALVNDKDLPLSWKLTIPSKSIDISISTRKDEQWNYASVPYYEGMVSVDGTHNGEGFLELTGY